MIKPFHKKKDYKVTDRTSSITSIFVKSAVPMIPATDAEIHSVLTKLKLDHNEPLCAYCRSVKATDWDHFRPSVKNKQGTGYITEIFNMVPSCGTCNQSKGGRNWYEWLKGEASKAPQVRLKIDVTEIVEILTEFENWSNQYVRFLDYKSLNPETLDLLKEYNNNLLYINDKLHESQELALEIKNRIREEKNWR